jgi:single-strand DNA-binding protein
MIGRLTKDPEMRYTTTNNIPVASFGLAVNRPMKKEEEQKADFFNVTVWNKTAEFVSKYFVKGQQIGLTGKIQNKSYETKEGQKVNTFEIIADSVYFADSKKTNNEQTNNEITANTYPDDDDGLPF